MEEIIEALPKNIISWANGVTMYNYQGYWSYKEFIEGAILAQQSYKAQPTDILICSYPKTGTTWLKALAFAIATRHKFDESTNPLLTTMPHECIPFLERDLEKIVANHQTGFPLVATHLPYASLPESVRASDCKIVYIYRNTKDVIVSHYHFLRNILKVPEESWRFKEACEGFCRGVSSYGPYWDHILGYWKACQERPGKVLFLKYEDMKKDTVSDVKRLAEFIGYPFSDEEEKAGMVENIIELCSFEKLSNLEVNKSGRHRVNDEKLAMENRFYFRKAKAGDWENYFTDEMIEKIDNLMEEKLSGTGLIFK